VQPYAMLIKHKARIDLESASNDTALVLAAEAGNVGSVTALAGAVHVASSSPIA
jgi:hypothetical protein